MNEEPDPGTFRVLEQTESLESAIMEGLSTISDEPKEKWKLYISGVFEIYKENLAAIRDGRKSRMSEVLRGITMREMNP